MYRYEFLFKFESHGTQPLFSLEHHTPKGVPLFDRPRSINIALLRNESLNCIKASALFYP